MVIKHVVVVNKRIQQNIFFFVKTLIGFSKNISSVELRSYKCSDYNINTVDESPDKS